MRIKKGTIQSVIHYKRKLLIMKILNSTILKPFLFLLPVVMLTTSCNREENLTFQDFDTDSDGIISPQEFEAVFTANYYDDWNREDDEYLDDEDFYHGTYYMWDQDEDNTLSHEEWIMGYDHYYGNYIFDDYEGIDVDGDGFIEYEEYSNVLGDTDYYLNWDTDASEYLDEEELANGVFRIWDIDNSGLIEKDEFAKFDSYYLDI